MNLNFRNFGFDLRERILTMRNPGKSVSSYLKTLENYQSKEFGDLSLQKYQEDAVADLISTAVENCAFYSKYRNLGFNDFPVVNKGLISSNQKEFISRKYETSKLTIMHTSGSTGVPFKVYQNAEKRKRLAAELIYYYGLLGYKVGDPLFFFAMAARVSRSNSLRLWMQNQRLFDITDLSGARIKTLLSELNNFPQAVVLGYPTTFEALSNYISSHKMTELPRLNALVSSGAILDDVTRKRLREALGCQFVNRYSNQENGVLGQDGELDNIFQVNVAHYYIEILEMESDEAVADGEIGRVVVTDLYNYAMPMIRYDTGDIASMETMLISGKKTRVIKDLSGRKLDAIFDEADRMVSPHTVVNAVLNSDPEVRQVQVVQIGRGDYVIRIAAEQKRVRQEHILQDLRMILGKNATFKIEFTDDIPILSSGKRRTVVSNYKPMDN
ncbi:MAG: hypothetical protein Q4F10_09485 [Corynebacterium glutamicum]|nr:hypothetical protein [Corynebacterium glutamicum]